MVPLFRAVRLKAIIKKQTSCECSGVSITLLVCGFLWKYHYLTKKSSVKYISFFGIENSFPPRYSSAPASVFQLKRSL